MRAQPALSYLLPCVALLLNSLATRADDAVTEEAAEIARVRSLFHSAENSGEAETVIRDAFGDHASATIRSLEALKESDLIAQVDSWDKESPALRDRMLLEAARRLADSGTNAPLALLREIAAKQPLVLVLVPGCRRSLGVPVFDLAHEARRAEFDILRRAHENDFAQLDPKARLEWLLETAALPGDAPRLAAALRLLREQPGDVRERLRVALLGYEGQLSDTAGQLLVEAWLADHFVPRAAELRRLSVLAAQRLVQDAARQDAASYRLDVLDVARSHAGVASLAAHLDGERGRLSPRRYLERDGASAASVLARDPSASMTRSLAAVLADASAPEAVRRHAALALLHQETPEARDAVAAALLSSELPPTLARKLRSWLTP